MDVEYLGTRYEATSFGLFPKNLKQSPRSSEPPSGHTWMESVANGRNDD